MFKPYDHQVKFSELWGNTPQILNFSGCGTGKTLSCIHTVKTFWPGARVLVLGPLTILRNAWGQDLNLGWPETTWEIAYAKNRVKVFEGDAQWIITNHDAIKKVYEMGWHKKFDVIIVDEADAFRNRKTQRSKALVGTCRAIPTRCLMTGTPTPKSITDVWHLAFAIDFGERLGKNYFQFQSQVCTPTPIYGAPPGAMNWTDKPGANEMVMAQLHDIVTRVSLDEVAELPTKITRDIPVTLPRKIQSAYYEFLQQAKMEFSDGAEISALQAGAKFQKLLQLVSGAMYDGTGGYKDIHTDRHKLILDLVEETDHCLVAFNWAHQRDGLVAEAKSRKVEYAVIDGSTPIKKREAIVRDFQSGKIRVLFAHPASAGHGITLTKANRVVWASPTNRADLYEQFNHRIYRHGQTRKSEVIHVYAENTIEVEVYEKLMGKTTRMNDLLFLAVEMSA